MKSHVRAPLAVQIVHPQRPIAELVAHRMSHAILLGLLERGLPHERIAEQVAHHDLPSRVRMMPLPANKRGLNLTNKGKQYLPATYMLRLLGQQCIQDFC